MEVFASFDVSHTRLFVPSGCFGRSDSSDTAPPEKATACSYRCGGSRFLPALKLEMNDGEYPVYSQKPAALPRFSDNHCANVSMVELSQKVNVNATKSKTNIWDYSLMENKTFERRRARLAKWMDDKHLSQVDVATRSNKTRSYISLLLSAGKSFGEKTARHMEKSLLMPALHLDKSDEDGLSPIVVWNTVNDLPQGVYAMVPRISISLSAGNGIVAEQERDVPPLAFTEEWIRSRNVSSRDNLRICKVSGDSMSPFLENADSVMIDLGQKSVIDNKVYCIRYGDELRIKRLSKRFDGGLRIISDNKDYPEESLSPEQCEHVAVIGRQIWRAG